MCAVGDKADLCASSRGHTSEHQGPHRLAAADMPYLRAAPYWRSMYQKHRVGPAEDPISSPLTHKSLSEGTCCEENGSKADLSVLWERGEGLRE